MTGAKTDDPKLNGQSAARAAFRSSGCPTVGVAMAGAGIRIISSSSSRAAGRLLRLSRKARHAMKEADVHVLSRVQQDAEAALRGSRSAGAAQSDQTRQRPASPKGKPTRRASANARRDNAGREHRRRGHLVRRGLLR